MSGRVTLISSMRTNIFYCFTRCVVDFIVLVSIETNGNYYELA